jgi:hypothetical protein
VNRTTGINSAKLYTPTQDGVFRPTLILTCTVGNGQAGFLSPSIGWTNELGQALAIGFYATATEKPSGGITTSFSPSFRAVKGVPITLSIRPEGPTDGSEYNAYIILEQLE